MNVFQKAGSCKMSAGADKLARYYLGKLIEGAVSEDQRLDQLEIFAR
jgi:hypothetical protein